MAKGLSDVNYHPFAEKFPLIHGEQWESFKASIAETKGPEQAVAYRMVKGAKQGLDGRNREKACEELGIPCRYEKVCIEDKDVKAYILRRNVHRRHLTPELRREIVGELRADGQSTRTIAETLGVNQATVVRDLKIADTARIESNGPGDANASPAVKGADGKIYPAKAPAKVAPPPGAGDSWEPPANPEPPAAPKRQPQTGKVIFDNRKMDEAFGVLVRLTTAAGKAYGQGGRHLNMAAALEKFICEWKAWKKELR
jgi:hypothetical protein